MPQCRHCLRDRPTCEVRRTTLGFVCKERSELREHSRCMKIAAELRATGRRDGRRSVTA